MNAVHISTARAMLDSHDPVSLSFLTADNRLLHVDRAVSLRYDRYAGTRRIKILDSREIRQIRDCLIITINNLEVFI